MYFCRPLLPTALIPEFFFTYIKTKRHHFLLLPLVFFGWFISITCSAQCQTGCPAIRSRVEEGRRCRKPCKSDSDCKSPRKRCRCDNVCGMTCFNPSESLSNDMKWFSQRWFRGSKTPLVFAEKSVLQYLAQNVESPATFLLSQDLMNVLFPMSFPLFVPR